MISQKNLWNEIFLDFSDGHFELSYIKIGWETKKLVFLSYSPLLVGSQGNLKKGVNPKANTYMYKMTLILGFYIEIGNSRCQ